MISLRKRFGHGDPMRLGWPDLAMAAAGSVELIVGIEQLARGQDGAPWIIVAVAWFMLALLRPFWVRLGWRRRELAIWTGLIEARQRGITPPDWLLSEAERSTATWPLGLIALGGNVRHVDDEEN